MCLSAVDKQKINFSLRNFLPDDTVKRAWVISYCFFFFCFCVVQVGSIRATVHDMYRVFLFDSL